MSCSWRDVANPDEARSRGYEQAFNDEERISSESRCALPACRLLVMSATLGGDLGERLAALLADEEGNAAGLLVSPGRQFPVKTTFLGAPGLPGDLLPRHATSRPMPLLVQLGASPVVARRLCQRKAAACTRYLYRASTVTDVSRCVTSDSTPNDEQSSARSPRSQAAASLVRV